MFLRIRLWKNNFSDVDAMKLSRSTRYVYLPVAVVATAIRAVLFWTYLHSSLSCYSRVVGLDMETLMRLGKAFTQGGINFNFHAALTGLLQLWGLGPSWVVAAQMAGGVVTALAVAYAALHLFGKRLPALICGLLAASYAPALMYEAVTLKESTSLMLAALALAAAIRMHRCRFSGSGMVPAGVVCMWPAWVRISGLCWPLAVTAWMILIWLRQRQKWTVIFRRLGYWCGGIILWYVIVVGINWSVECDTGVFMLERSHLEVIWAITAKKEINDLNTAPGVKITNADYLAGTMIRPKEVISWSDRMLRAGKYFLMTLKPFEICNNTNYYFMRDRFFPLGWLPGPLLLIPPALTGFLLMLLSVRWWRRREALIFWYIASYALPLAFWVPLARYRVVLLPVFCLGAVWGWRRIYGWWCSGGGKGRLSAGLAVLLFAAVLFWSLPSSYPLRDSDFVTDGKAWEYKQGRGAASALGVYRQGWLLFPASAALAVNYGDALLRRGNYPEAEQVLSMANRIHPDRFSIVLLHASSLLAGGKAAAAETLLSRQKVPEAREAKLSYYFTLGECFRLTGRTGAALAAYRQALACAAGERQRQQLSGLIRQLENAPR